MVSDNDNSTMAKPSTAVNKRKRDDEVESPGKRFTSTYSDIITVLVGAKKERFTVHQDLICGHSEFFKAACSNGWKEAETKTVTLEDFQPYCFKVYLERLYDPNADLTELAMACHEDFAAQYRVKGRIASLGGTTRHILCELWICGDFLGDDLLCNQAIDALISVNLRRPLQTWDTTAKRVWNNTSDNSALRKWFIDAYAPFLSHSTLKLRGSEDLPADMWLRLLRACVTNKEVIGSRQSIQLSARCDYHKHPDGTARCA